MTYKCIILLALFIIPNGDRFILSDFSKNEINDWLVVDDTVMGGNSFGNFEISPNGKGVFYGNISLENNGGFSSIRYRFAPINIRQYSIIRIRLKGDRKRYQLRIKDDSRSGYSYINYFETSGIWEEIEIPFRSLYPSFRGRKLGGTNFDKSIIEEIGFLIGNKREEGFKLIIDFIEIL